MCRRNTNLVIVWVALLGLADPDVSGAIAQVRSASTNATASEAAEKAIRKSAADFEAAFNRHDAQAIAQMWTADGEYVDEAGQLFRGRDAIEKEYVDFFKANPNINLSLVVDSVRLLNPTVAIEDGRAVLQPMPEAPGISRYTAVHLKQDDGRWLVAIVRDSRVAVANSVGKLRELGWLVGEWVADHAGAQVEVRSRWDPTESFLRRRFVATRDGKVTSASTEIIAWDPLTKQIRSWTFSSGGGRAEGVWHPQEQGWLVAHSGVMADGTPTASTDMWTQLLGDAIGWQSFDRAAGGALLDDARNVVLKKQPAESADQQSTRSTE